MVSVVCWLLSDGNQGGLACRDRVHHYCRIVNVFSLHEKRYPPGCFAHREVVSVDRSRRAGSGRARGRRSVKEDHCSKCQSRR